MQLYRAGFSGLTGEALGKLPKAATIRHLMIQSPASLGNFMVILDNARLVEDVLNQSNKAAIYLPSAANAYVDGDGVIRVTSNVMARVHLEIGYTLADKQSK